MIEHHIQKEILLRLSKAATLRFSELKPKELESNSFMYHLQQLIKQKLVSKTVSGYELSDEGLAYIDGFSFHTLKPRKQPKLISILVVRNETGEWLLAKRKYQPYIGQYMFVSGKQHLGEDPASHAQRELREKLEMVIPLKRRGMSDIRIFRGDNLITHVTAHIYEGFTRTNKIPAETNQFEFKWVKPKDSNIKLLAGTDEIMEKLETETDLFFMSLDAKDE
jgi:8-oxo-dGTP pyrophosphatase MutT (NUDIX family)